MITLDIEIYENYGKGEFAQEKYLVHGWDDVLWTSDLDDALQFLKQSIIDMQNKSTNT